MSSEPVFGNPFIELNEVESTNNYAMGLVHEGMAQHGAAIFTTNQTKGKGQRNKTWESEAGKNLALSIVLQPPLSTSEMFLLSAAAAAATHRLIQHYAGEETSIKWPNDIYWRDRKAAGILIENVVQQQKWKFAVAGIGINVNQTEFSSFSNRAVSLKQITGQTFDVKALAKSLLVHFKAYYSMISSPDMLLGYYNQHLFKKGEVVKLKKSARTFDAIIKRVTMDGRLVAVHGVEEQYGVGEIEWIIQ